MTHVDPFYFIFFFLKRQGVHNVTAEPVSSSERVNDQRVRSRWRLLTLWSLTRFSSPLVVLVGTVDWIWKRRTETHCPKKKKKMPKWLWIKHSAEEKGWGRRGVGGLHGHAVVPAVLMKAWDDERGQYALSGFIHLVNRASLEINWNKGAVAPSPPLSPHIY